MNSNLPLQRYWRRFKHTISPPRSTVPGFVLRPQYLEPIPAWLGITRAVYRTLSKCLASLRWQYRYLVFDTKDQRAIHCALASRDFRKKAPARVKSQTAIQKVIQSVLETLDEPVRSAINEGTLEFSGWRELANSVSLSGVLMWSYTRGSNHARHTVHLFLPSLQIVYSESGMHVHAADVGSLGAPELNMTWRTVEAKQTAAFKIALDRLGWYILDNKIARVTLK